MKEMFHSSNRIYQFGLNIAGVLMLKKFKKVEFVGRWEVFLCSWVSNGPRSICKSTNWFWDAISGVKYQTSLASILPGRDVKSRYYQARWVRILMAFLCMCVCVIFVCANIRVSTISLATGQQPTKGIVFFVFLTYLNSVALYFHLNLLFQN